MNKHISAHYIKEKIKPVKNLITTVEYACDNGESDNINNEFSESQRREIAFAFAVIAKELDVQIPDV